jgi:hypothetical protein
MDIEDIEVGCTVHLTVPYKGWSIGEVTGVFGAQIEVRLTNGKEVICYADELEEA